MKTIEERAYDIISEVMTMDDLYSRDEVVMMLERMAEEQQAIDEDHFRSLTKMLINKICKWVDDNVGTLTAIALRKAMENHAYCKEGEGKIRPYQSREEMIDAMKEHGDYVVWKYNLDWFIRILGFSDKRVNIEGHYNTTMEEAMNGFRWADGHPFGKEE